MKYIVLISAVLGAVLLYLLSHASTRSASVGNYYNLLLILNVALAVVLIVLIGLQLWRLYRQIRHSIMGSRLTLRLLGNFALMAIIPGVIVYAVSVNFLTRSIESWFNVKVEAALEGGVRLGQSALDIMLSDLEDKAETMALSLAFQPGNLHLSALNDLREKSGVRDAVLLTLQGRILAFSSSDPSSFLPDLPSIPQLRQGRQHIYGVIEPILGKGLYLRVLAPVTMNDMAGETRVLQLLQPVPQSLSETAEAVQGVYEDYQELSFSRESLKEVFALTLTLVLMLAMLSSIAIAFLLSRRLSAPLGILAEGTRAIARGDYSTVLPAHGKDELGILVQSFNSMSYQLNEATQAADRNRIRLEAAHGYLETILAHLSSGVLVLGEHGQLRTFNYAASHILGVQLNADTLNQPLELLAHQQETLASFVNRIQVYFKADPAAEWQEQLEISTSQGKQVLLVRGTRLPDGPDSGFVVVFDDITQMAQAQRDAAWAEVARRLAHEIKNPLTPIQLSAERLEHKLAAKLDAPDAEMLSRATATIVSQVNAMKTMVNEFSEYARLPALSLDTVDLRQLIQDVLGLYEAGHVNITLDIPAELPKVHGDATMLRQVLHNLLQNAQDALENHPQPEITISCHLADDRVRLCVMDNGTGFPLEILSHAFEPYMTTKRHGTGLGLAIVRKIIEEHKGSIKVENLETGGAAVIITIPIAERKQ